MDNILEISNLEKSYGNKKVLKRITLSVKRNEILGFLGPNGAGKSIGKSTPINILSTVLKADAGRIMYCKKPIRDQLKKYKMDIGVVPQNLAIYENLSAIDNVKSFSQFYQIDKNMVSERARNTLEMVGLKERAYELANTFSGGMKRRLNIACALAHNPKLLILNEPTVGVDPQSRNRIMEVIHMLNRQGTSVIYTTHYKEEVEAICDRVIIIDQGRILKIGNIEELRKGRYRKLYNLWKWYRRNRHK